MSAVLDEHFGYLADSVRGARLREAIRRVVRSGDRVADLGCGSGVLGLWCLQAGAVKVWGIDSTTILHAARETMARAGLAERYVCLQDSTFSAVLPESVDLLVCDHVGYFGIDYGILEMMQDARRRFLKQGGRVLPRRVKLSLALASSDEGRRKAEAWAREPVPAEYHWLRALGHDTKHALKLEAAHVIGAPASLATIDLTADTPEVLSFSAELAADRDAPIDGLAGWFDCELAEGIWMTNSPLAAGAIDRPQAFFPIAERVTVRAGETLRATIIARPADSILAWTLQLPGGRRFQHSTWKSQLMAESDLVRAQPERVPRLNRAGLARRTILSYCDGHRTAREIEAAVLREHPDLMPSPGELSRVVAITLSRDTD